MQRPRLKFIRHPVTGIFERTIMKGKILAYCDNALTGVIADNAGKEYPFTRRDWINLGQKPEAGQYVTFDGKADLAKYVMISKSE